MDFNGGFHPGDSMTVGRKMDKRGIAPVIVDTGSQYADLYHHLILGTVDDVRSFALGNRELNVKWSHQPRESWYYDGGAKDSGYPIDGAAR